MKEIVEGDYYQTIDTDKLWLCWDCGVEVRGDKEVDGAFNVKKGNCSCCEDENVILYKPNNEIFNIKLC